MAWSLRGLALLGLAAALTAAMSAPAFPQPGAVAAAVAGGPRATVGVPFALRMGARAEIAGTGWVSFAAVPDDSRCPIDVLCVWGGLARIRLEVGWIDPGGVAHLDAIEIDTIGLTAGAAGLTFRLLAVKPARVSTAVLDPADYAALLLIEAGAGKGP